MTKLIEDLKLGDKVLIRTENGLIPAEVTDIERRFGRVSYRVSAEGRDYGWETRRTGTEIRVPSV